MQKEPISIIVTAFHSQDFIEECLDSIEKQTYFIDNNNFEVLLGIDSCQDTLKKVNQIRHKYRNLKVLMMDSNKGTYVTSNTLIYQAKHSFIRFDSDDIMYPYMIETIMKYYNEHKVIRYKYKNFRIEDGKIVTQGLVSRSFTHGSMFFDREIFMKELFGYRDWICAADTEIIKRYGEEKIGQIETEIPMFMRRIHSSSLTQAENTKYGSLLRKSYHSLILSNTLPKIFKPVTNTFKIV